MMKKTLCVIFAVIISINFIGCSTQVPIASTPPDTTFPEESTAYAEDSVTAITPAESQPDTTEPELDSVDRYESGKPYTPWGEEENFTLTTSDGTILSFSANIPTMRIAGYISETIWNGTVQNQGIAFLVSCIDSGDVKNLEDFFDNSSEQLLQTYRSAYVTRMEVVIKLMDPSLITYKDVQMCQVRGAISYKTTVRTGADSFIGYAMQTQSGDYLYWLVLCTGSDWSPTQEAAENFYRTFQES